MNYLLLTPNEKAQARAIASRLEPLVSQPHMYLQSSE